MTIYDIAKAAGVAGSTVSRVINNKPGVKKETREKIQKILDEKRYAPNQAARGLVTHSTKLIGILIEDIRVIHHTAGAYFMEQELTKLGYIPITMSTGPDPKSKAEYINILEQRSIDGAILMGSMFSREEVKASILEHLPNIPIVIVNGYIDLPNVYGVLVDEEEGMRSLTRLLFKSGKKNLVFACDQDTPSNYNKIRGFKHGIKQGKGSIEEPIVYTNSGIGLQDGYVVTEKILKEHPDTDAILYSIDLLAAGGIQSLHDHDIKIPEQIAVTGVDNSIYGEICNPKLTTLDNRQQDLCISASRILIEALESKKIPEKIQLFSNIVIRQST